MITTGEASGEVLYATWLNEARKLLESADNLAEEARGYGSLILAHIEVGVPSPANQFTSEYFNADGEIFVRIFDKTALKGVAKDPQLGHINIQSSLATNVSRNRKSAIILPPYSDHHPLVNAHLLLHEGSHALDHYLQRHDHLPESQRVGASERNAYGLNISLIEAMIGKRFSEYVSKYPFVMSCDLDGTQITTQIVYPTDFLPQPTKGTPLYDLWTCRSFFESVVRVARAEAAYRNLPRHITNQLIGNFNLD